jgi:hypothetical protein
MIRPISICEVRGAIALIGYIIRAGVHNDKMVLRKVQSCFMSICTPVLREGPIFCRKNFVLTPSQSHYVGGSYNNMNRQAVFTERSMVEVPGCKYSCNATVRTQSTGQSTQMPVQSP